jgi:Glycosyl hydrolase family 12
MMRSLGTRRARLLIAASASGTLVASPMPPSAYAATTTCAPFGTVSVAGGGYIVQQNEWNSRKEQCISVSGTSWIVTIASFRTPTAGPPASYPSIFKGCHWGLCSLSTGLPIQVGKLTRARSSWRTSQVAAGAYSVSYDIWTNSTRSTAGQPNGSEIMIWLASRGRVQPAGSRVGTVTVGGASWEIWTARMSGWNYIAYRRATRTASVRDLHIGAFIRDSVHRGSTRKAWYVIDAEAGFEIWKGGSGLGTKSFSLSITYGTSALSRKGYARSGRRQISEARDAEWHEIVEPDTHPRHHGRVTAQDHGSLVDQGQQRADHEGDLDRLPQRHRREPEPGSFAVRAP